MLIVGKEEVEELHTSRTHRHPANLEEEIRVRLGMEVVAGRGRSTNQSLVWKSHRFAEHWSEGARVDRLRELFEVRLRDGG